MSSCGRGELISLRANALLRAFARCVTLADLRYPLLQMQGFANERRCDRGGQRDGSHVLGLQERFDQVVSSNIKLLYPSGG